MCWKCLKDISLSEPVSRTAECPECHRDLHCCKNCIFYSCGSHYDCHETIEEPVYDKEKNNFCENFKIKRVFNSSKEEFSKSCDARKAFDSLFSL